MALFTGDRGWLAEAKNIRKKRIGDSAAGIFTAGAAEA